MKTRATALAGQRRNIATLLFLAWIAAAAFWAWRADPLASWSRRISDGFVPQEQASDSIVIVSIDEAAFDRYGAITLWPRTLFAQAVERLRENGARVIALDILVAKPKPGDDDLQAAMQKAIVVLPVDRKPSGDFDEPTAPLAAAAAGLGHVNVLTESDGMERRIQAELTTSAGVHYPPYAALAVDRYVRASTGPPPAIKDGRLRLAGRSAPLEDGMLRIAFDGGLSRFRVVSFLDLIDGRIPRDAVAGKLAFVGVTPIAGLDNHLTPSGRMAGVTLQANAADTLVKGRYLRSVELAPLLLGGLILAAGLAIVMTRVAFAAGAGAALGVIAAYVVASWLLPLEGWIIDPLYVPLLLGLSLTGSLLWRFADAQNESAFFGTWFRRVASPEILSELDRGGAHALRSFDASRLRLEGFRIVDELGSGTSGVVYKAEERGSHGRTVAIKRLYPHLARDGPGLERFRREARLLAGVRSPNVVRLLDFIEDERSPFLVMEYVDGQSLEERLRQHGALSAAEAAEIAAQAAQGLADALSHHVLHRDVKPQNILLAKDGTVKVTDFGLAAIEEDAAVDATVSEGFVGTVRYAAPEATGRYGQLGSADRPVDARSDVYSLGLVLYEMIAGVPAFGGTSVFDVLAARERWALPKGTPLDAHPELRAILVRCLADDPEERFQHAGEIAGGLRSYLAAKEHVS